MSRRLCREAVPLVLALAIFAAPALGFPDNPFLFTPPPDTAPPWSVGQGQMFDALPPDETNFLYARLRDDAGLAEARLFTNESGVMAPFGLSHEFSENLQAGAALFAWRNAQLAPGTEVAWKIAFRDRAGRTNETDARTCRVAFPSPPSLPSPHNTTFTVCPAGCDFMVIQDAINAANDNDTVLALNGTHLGPVVVNRSITLRGESRDNTTIDGQGASVVVWLRNTSNLSDFLIRNGVFGVVVGHGELKGANGSRVERIGIDSSINVVGVVVPASDVVVDSNRIQGELGLPGGEGGQPGTESKPVWGFFVTGVNATLSRNQVNGTDFGISFEKTIPFDLIAGHNTVRDNNVSFNLNNGIAIHGGGGFCTVECTTVLVEGDWTIENNTVLGHTNQPGIQLLRVRNSTIARNHVALNNIGIAAFGAPTINNTFRENNASFNSAIGIFIFRGGGNTLIDNIAIGNQFAGIMHQSQETSPDNRIANNTVSFGFVGIYALLVSNSTIEGNNLTSNFAGIALASAVNNSVRFNNVTGTSLAGIALFNSSGNELQGNRVFDTLGVGIALLVDSSLGETSNSNRLLSNNATNNTIGIFLNLSDDTTVAFNNASFNTEDGIRLQDSPNNTISNNIAWNNSRFGIYVNWSNNTPTTGNDVQFNFHGIYYETATNNTATGNTANNNTDDGVRMGNSSGCTIAGNTIQFNNHGIHLINPNPCPVGGNFFASNNQNVVIEFMSPALRLAELFGGTVLNGIQSGITAINANSGLIEGSLLSGNRVSIKFVDSTNITLKDLTILQSGLLDISMVNSTARLVNTTVDPAKVQLINSTLEGLISVVPATVDIDPNTLSKKSGGQFITAYIELPSGFNVADIDVSSVKLDGVVPVQASPTAVGDHDNDGIPDLMVKFSRSAVQSIVSLGSNALNVSGTVAGTPFTGSGTIRIINPGD